MNMVLAKKVCLRLCRQIVHVSKSIKLPKHTVSLCHKNSFHLCDALSTSCNNVSFIHSLSDFSMFSGDKHFLVVKPNFELSGPTESIKHLHQKAGQIFRTYSSSDSHRTEGVTVKNKGMSEYKVHHDKDKQYFYIKLPDDSKNEQDLIASLEYEWVRPGLVNMYHTEVPPHFQGKGIAKILAQAAFDTFCQQDVMMRPTCTYLQKYLRDNSNPNYRKHIEKDFVL